MRKIVAISPPVLSKETLEIDKELVKLTSKEHPKALFIPTARNDDANYWNTFRNVYGKKLGCDTDVLYLINQNLKEHQIREKILSSDMIYVDGGNTLKMMRLWRRLGVDRMLENAHDQGIVLSGYGAGSICWFKYGYSNSLKYYNPDDWKYIMVRGLGLINAINCTHYDDKRRDSAGQTRSMSFRNMLRRRSYTEVCIAMDDNCAIEFVDDSYRVLTTKGGANVYRITKEKGELVTAIVERKTEYTPIEALLKGN